MEKLKKLLKKIPTILLVCLICILLISVNLKTVIVNGVIKETIKTEVINKEHKEKNVIIEEEINNITDDPRIKEILNSPEIQEIMNKYLDTIVEGLINDNENLNDLNIEKDIYDYIKENKEVIEQKASVKIDDETIEKVKEMNESKQLSKNLKLAIQKQSKTITKKEKTVLKGYKLLTSIIFQLILVLLILLDLLLIWFINKKSIKAVVKELGISSIISGILTILISIVVKIIVITTTQLKTFHMRNLFISGIGIVIIGILILLIKKKLEKKVNLRYTQNF